MDINLVPDVKADFIKSQRVKRIIQILAFLFSAILIGLVILAFVYVKVWQQRHTDSLQDDINSIITSIRSEQDLDKVQTLSLQLESLDSLHDDKELSSNLQTILTSITPENVSYDSVRVNFEDSEINFKGEAEDTLAVNRFADVLKFTEYKIGEDGSSDKAFEDVTTDVRVTDNSELTTFSITSTYSDGLFSDKALDVQVTNFCGQESCITTRSEVERPKSLFNGPAGEES